MLKPFVFLALLAMTAAPGRGQQAAPAGATASTPCPLDGGPMHIGSDVRPPSVLSSVEPGYTDEARAAHFQGTVQVYLWVDQHGNPSHVRVIRGVGMGIDEKAVEAVRQYKFNPAMRNGCPVKVDLYLEVNFRLSGQ